MNYKDRLARVSPHLMTLTGFFHGIIRMEAIIGRPRREVRPYVVRYHILKCLERRGPHTLTAVSSILQVKKNSLSELLDRMAKDGLVVREPDPGDRRKIALGVTDAGRAAIRTFERSLMANMGRFLERLDPADRRDLVLAIESLVRILERHAAPAAGQQRPT